MGSPPALFRKNRNIRIKPANCRIPSFPPRLPGAEMDGRADEPAGDKANDFAGFWSDGF